MYFHFLERDRFLFERAEISVIELLTKTAEKTKRKKIA
tara:strand:- start:1171 stop:1284 length:114 start_codon:yes stop_codon:yes gene_type:complete